MSESTKSVESDEMSTTTRDCPEGILDAAPRDATGQAVPSVRELLAELAQLEDATRDLGGVRRPVWTVQTPDLLAALAREQEIIDELHRRCPDAHPAPASSATTTRGTASASTADENGAAGRA
ncbi:MAG: hypothetical protein ABIO48_16830 [Pedococcus sp.]